ncbi:hypothetical protein GGR57DRAFT_480184 [Xylariaceae sp. FL1272]|nr:hypothetical protein GGR57DRAFT_480184 [Xylariaceae sp. FL1272]
MAPDAAPNETDTSVTDSATAYARLHITPFDQSLLNTVISASAFPRARNISYHTIEAFPEKRFGFVDLPAMDAEKLKKKLNGAVLKGSKMRIETARPETIPGPTAPGDEDSTATKKDKKKSKKRKREAGVAEGVELEDRKIKRGWTVTEKEMIEEKRKKSKRDKEKKDNKSKDEKKDKKDKKEKRSHVKSKYTDEPECLFKTKLPAVAPSKPDKEDDDDASHKKKRKRKSDREVTVHEFEKTTRYPSFLKSSSATGGAEPAVFKDGIGWVDSDGNVVEPVRSNRRPEGIPAPKPPPAKKPAPAPAPVVDEEDDDDETSSSGSSSSDEDQEPSSSEDEEEEASSDIKPTETAQLKVNTKAPSSPSIARPESARPKSSGSITSLSIKIPPTTPATKKVHPLEALYKRPQGDNDTANAGPEAQPFSFFGAEDGDDIEEDDTHARSGQPPMTPYTKQDFDFRNVRSAAPTPDTAHPTRSFNLWSRGSVEEDNEEENQADGLENVEEEDEEEDEAEDVNMADSKAEDTTTVEDPVSDFQKQFWENRGNLNRAWRKRKKTAAKEKRYRENRARADRAI